MPIENRGEHVAYRKDRGWWGILRYENGNRVWVVGRLSSREEANVELAKRVLSKGKRNTDEVTLGELMAYYLENRAPFLARPDNALFFHTRLKGFWANKRLKDLTQSNIRLYKEFANKEYQKWQKEDKHKKIKSISDAAIRRYMEHLRACVKLAAKDHLIPAVPVITLPEKGKAKDRWLTRKEAATLIREARKLPFAKEYLPHFIRIALRTGARKSAVLTARKPQIDLENQTIDFRRIQRSKNKGAAVAAIPDKQMPYFRAYMRGISETGYLIHSNNKRVNEVEKGFATACKNAGLDGVTIHTLRHTFASWLKQDGASVSDIAEALGHTSTVMVDTTYAHMGKGYVERIRKAVR